MNICFISGASGSKCIYPTISCSQTKYPSKCSLSCPIGYKLKGESEIFCQSNGLWKNSQSFCKRDNEPPTGVSFLFCKYCDLKLFCNFKPLCKRDNTIGKYLLWKILIKLFLLKISNLLSYLFSLNYFKKFKKVHYKISEILAGF